MQELILIISRCVSKRRSAKGGKILYKFHFKGYYAGEKIKVIQLFYSNSDETLEHLSKGDDYLLWVKRKRISQEVLEVELIKYKRIS